MYSHYSPERNPLYKPSFGSNRFLPEQIRQIANHVSRVRQSVKDVLLGPPTSFTRDVPFEASYVSETMRDHHHDIASSKGRTKLRRLLLALGVITTTIGVEVVNGNTP